MHVPFLLFTVLIVKCAILLCRMAILHFIILIEAFLKSFVLLTHLSKPPSFLCLAAFLAIDYQLPTWQLSLRHFICQNSVNGREVPLLILRNFVRYKFALHLLWIYLSLLNLPHCDWVLFINGHLVIRRWWPQPLLEERRYFQGSFRFSRSKPGIDLHFWKFFKNMNKMIVCGF